MDNKIQNLEGEVWKELNGYEGKYLISNKGRFKCLSKQRSKFDSNSKESLILLKNDGSGYFQVRATKNSITKTFRIHRLVAEYFIPNKNNYPQVNHKNGDKSDNTSDNLEWCTIKQNCIHSQENGLQGKRRFTFNDAEDIRKLKREGMKEVDIAKIYKTTYAYIRKIIVRKKWDKPILPVYGAAKISEEKVLEIRKKLSEGFSIIDLSKTLNLSYNIIHGIKNNKTWKHVQLQD